MAECSYARCVQQKRNIRRELQRWTKNMVHIVGLERIAEELMGRRKWKLYQESMSRNYLQPLNNNIKRTNPSEESDYHHKDKQQQQQQQQQQNSDPEEAKTVVETKEINGEDGGKGCGGENERTPEHQKENEEKDAERLKDWTPETKCYFCVDGKLDSEHSTHGVSSPRPSESDTSDSLSDHEIPTSLTPTSRGLINNNHHHHRPIIHHPVTPPSAPAGMTTIENAMALAMAAFSGGGAASPGGTLPAAPQLPFYNPVITHNWYLATRSFQTAAAQAAQAAQQDVDKGGGGLAGEEPLDLSKGSSGGGGITNSHNNNSTYNGGLGGAGGGAGVGGGMVVDH